MDHTLPPPSRAPQRRLRTRLLLSETSARVSPSGETSASEKMSTSDKKRLKKFRKFSFQSLPMISASPTRTEVSRSFSDDPVFESANLNGWLCHTYGQFALAECHQNYLHQSSGVVSQQHNFENKFHKAYSGTRCERFHPYRRRFKTGLQFVYPVESDTENLDDFCDDHSWSGAEVLNFTERSSRIPKSSAPSISTKISTDCEFPLKRHTRCPLSHRCKQSSPSCGQYVGDFVVCLHENKTKFDGSWRSQLAPACKRQPMCVPQGDAHERVTRWRVTLLVAGTLPPLQVSKICDLIEGSSCSGAGYSARSHEEVTGCLKVLTHFGDELHFPVVQRCHLPCTETWTLELGPACVNYIRKLLHSSEMSHLQRSASESYSSNVLPPVGLERTSRLYAFKLMKNEKENVRKLLPYFIEKSKTDEKYVPFRSRRLSASKIETAKRKSDVCDVLMYREPSSKHGSPAPEGHTDTDTSQTIRLCGVPLGNRPLTTSGNVFCTMRRSGTMRFTSPPASPLFSAGGSPSSSPQRRLVDRDCSAPPGTLPTPSARAGDSLSSAAPIALVADRHDAKNTPQGPHVDHKALLQTLPAEASAGLIIPDDDRNSSSAEKDGEILCADVKIAPSHVNDPLDVRISPCVVTSSEDKTRPEKNDPPEVDSVFLPDSSPSGVGLVDLPSQPEGLPLLLDPVVSTENDSTDSLCHVHGDFNRMSCNTVNSVDECRSTILDLVPRQEQTALECQEQPALNLDVKLPEPAAVINVNARGNNDDSRKDGLEISHIAEQRAWQDKNANGTTDSMDPVRSDRARNPEHNFEKFSNGNETASNTDMHESYPLKYHEINLPSKIIASPQTTVSPSQNMVTFDETLPKDISAVEAQRRDADHERIPVVSEVPAENMIVNISSLDSQRTTNCDINDIPGDVQKDHPNNLIATVSEDFQVQDSSQSDKVSELMVFEKPADDAPCDSKLNDSTQILKNLPITEEELNLTNPITESFLPSVNDVHPTMEHHNNGEKFEPPKLDLTGSHQDDSSVISPGLHSGISNSTCQTVEASSEQNKKCIDLSVVPQHLEIGTDGDKYQSSADNTSEIIANGSHLISSSVIEPSEVISQPSNNLNEGDAFGETKYVEPYFVKSVNTFIDEDPEIMPFLSVSMEPSAVVGEQQFLPLGKADQLDPVVSTANVASALSHETTNTQPPVEVTQFSTFIDSGFGPNELNIPVSSEELVIQIESLPSAGGINDVQVKPLLSELNSSSAQTDDVAPNSGIISMIHMSLDAGEGTRKDDVRTEQPSLSNAGVCDQVTEMSVCTININPITTSPSTVETPTCDVQQGNSETHDLDPDAAELSRNSRPRRTCASDFNRGQALVDRAAKIARMHGASPSKPRPFAFPADVIRSPSQVSKSPRSSFVNKEPNADAYAIRSKSASPMTQKRVKRESTTKRLKSISPNSRLRVNLNANESEPNGNSPQVVNNSVSEVTKLISTSESNNESKGVSFINTVYVKVPSASDVNNSSQISAPATYVSNFTTVTYSDVKCNEVELVDSANQKTVRTELKLPRVSLIEEVEKVDDELTRWASYIANKMLVEIFDFDSPKWKNDYFARLCPSIEKTSVSQNLPSANESYSCVAKAPGSPDSASNDDSLSSARQTSKKGASASAGNSASSADRRTGREEDSTSSSFSSEAWWGQGGPVTHREQLPLKEDVELVPQWPGLPVPSVPESDVDRAGYASDEDFEAMDEDMRRLEEKIRQFEHELEEDLEMSLVEESSHRMPNFGLLDKTKLRSSPLPTQYPPVCMKKTKHFSFMSKKDIDDYLKTDSESTSSSSSSSSSDDDLFFVKKKIKLKPGDRKCFSLDLKKRSLIDECKSECLMKILSIPETDSKAEKNSNDISPESQTEEQDASETCLIQNDFKMTGEYWRSEDGLAVVDSEGLAEFYAGANPSGVCFIFEDESDDEDTLEESIAIALGETDIPLDEPLLESFSTVTPTESDANSVTIPSNPQPSKTEKKSKFVSSFKNSFVKATKSIGPKFGGKLSESGNENPIQGSPNSPSVDPASIISEILYGKTKTDCVTPKTFDVVDDVATFPASSESDACDSSIISGEYYASPAICVLSDEDSRVPEYNLFQQPLPRRDVSFLSAPPPPIRKSSLDAVSATTGSFRQQFSGNQEVTQQRMIADIPRVLPPPPSVPPRTATLNYYPVRSHPVHNRNTVKCDVNVDSQCFYKDIDHSSRQPDSAQRPKATSVRQLKRRQHERKLELAEEAKEEATGCNFCLRRSRTQNDSRHSRQRHRRSSPHPKALSLPQRRSWPPRVSSCMACCRWWSLPCHLHSDSASNTLVELDCLKPAEQPCVEDINDDRDTVSSSSVPCPENPNSPRSDLADASACWSDDSRSDSEFLWTPCALSLSVSKQEDDSMLFVNTSQSLHCPSCFERVVCSSLFETHECNPTHRSVSISKCTELCAEDASQMANLNVPLPPTLYRSLPLPTIEKESSELPITIFSSSCPQLIFYSIPNFFPSEELFHECSSDLSSSLSADDVSQDAIYHVPTSSLHCCPLMAYSASQSDLSSDL